MENSMDVETEQPAGTNDRDDRDEAWNVASATASAAILEDLENQYVGFKTERDNLQLQLEEAQGKLAELNKSIAQQYELEIQINKYKCEIEVSATKLDTVNTEQKLSQELIDRQQSEIDSLKDDVSRLTEKNNDLAKQVAEFEIQSKLTASDAIPLSYEKQRLETELSSLQTHSNFLEQELSSKSKQYLHLQRESRDRTIQLQLQLDQTISEKDALAARLSALEKIERKLQDKVNQLSLDNLNGKQELTTITQKYEVELQEERRIVSLQKDHLDRWKKRYEDVVKENENLKSTASHALVLSEKELENERNVLEQKYTALLSEQASEYESKIQSLTIAGTPRSAQRLLALPASTNADVDLTDAQDDEDVGLLSMTDLFQRLGEAKAALRKEQTDRKCWQLRFQQIQKQIRESAPQLIRQREEYDMAIDQLSDYQRRLEMALSERDEAMNQASEARAAAVKIQTRLADRQAESQELAKQVQALLVSASSGGNAGTNISSNIPTSIQEMQSQNQRLLSEHRRLTQQVAELEEMLNTDETRNQLEITKSALLKLQHERDEQENLVERIVQQRDLYRTLLAKHDSKLLGSEGDEITALELAKQQSVRVKKLETLNVELEGTIKKLRLERDKAVAEKDDAYARLKNHEVHSAEMMKSIEKLEQDLLTARSGEARVACDAQYHKDHCERLESSLERARSEIAHLNNDRSELKRITTQQQQLLSNASAECGSLESEKRQLENKVHLLQAQIETSKLTEKRVIEENLQLRTEVARQGSLIDSIRRIEASIVSNSDVEKEGLRNEKESLVKRLAEEASSRKVETENWNARIQQLEATLQDHTSSKEKLERDAVEKTLKLTEALAAVEKLTKQQKSLESLLAAAKKKLGETDTDSIEEITAQAKIQKLETELEASKDEISSLKENAETYKKIAKESETALAELQNHVNQFQSENKDEIEKLKKDLDFNISNNESKDELIRELTNDLANQRDEREKAISALKGTIANLETELENKVKDADSAKANAAVLVHDMEALRDEVTKAQRNFERELALHSEARTALRAAREELDRQTQFKLSAEEKLQEISSELNDTKRLLEEDKLLTKQEIEQLEKRLKDASDQNEVLHNQLESLTRIVDKIQADRISNVGAQSDTGGELNELDQQKVISELREIVKFLRSENAIIQTQLDTAKRVADRERAAANVIRRSLEETQVELNTIRDAGDTGNTQSTSDIEKKLLAAEEQLLLLKDSNKLLREEIDKLESQLSAVQKEADEARKSAEPAQNAERELKSKLASSDAENQSLLRELETWKNRVKSLVSKFHQIDPEEHKKLITQVGELQKEKESLNAWKKATEEESNRIRSIAKTLNQKSRDQKATIDAQQKDIEKLNAEKSSWASASTANAANAKELTEVKEKMSKMLSEAESMKRELEGANSRNDRLREKLREFQTMIRELRSKEKVLTEQLELAKAKTVGEKVEDANPSAPQNEAKQSDTKGGNSDESNAQNDPTIPAVPQGGFKFGPSESSRLQAEKQAEQKQQLESSLRSTAPTFVPTAVAADKGVSSVEKKDQEAVSSASKDAAVEKTSESSPPVPTSRSSATNKELSMKEILLAKKMKLQEALKRKQEAESLKNETTAPSAESSPKRAKVDKPQEEAKTVIEREPTPPPSSRLDSTHFAVAAPVTMLEPTKETDQENEPDAVNVEAEKGPDDSGENQVSESGISNSFVFSRTVTNPFASSFPTGGSQAGATIFGQSSSIIASQPSSFGSSVVPPSDETASNDVSTGGAFLDIKPPGSSATPPVFTFGSSSKITLPTPSIPPPANPFGTFASTTSFGSFGPPAGGIMPSIPLFGSSASILPQGEKTEEDSGDGKE